MNAFRWARGRAAGLDRQSWRALFSLEEELVACADPAEIGRKLAKVLPKALGVTRARLYLLNRRSRSLNRIPEAGGTELLSFSPESPPDARAAGAAMAFRNRTLLAIPDMRNSPVLAASPGETLPRAVLFVPMFAQNEVGGVLELDQDERPRHFTAEEQALAQHLANQAAIALHLMEHGAAQEQLFRSEKLAAAGQLISSVAMEIREPLENVLRAAESLIEQQTDETSRRRTQELAAEARGALETVTRVAAFARVEPGEMTQVNLSGLLSNLIDLREETWRAHGIEVRCRPPRDPVFVSGSESQLENVLLNLLAHAEQAIEGASLQRTISINMSVLARKTLIEISYPAGSAESAGPDPFSGSRPTPGGDLSLEVCRSIIRNHGGEIRLLRRVAQQARVEVELPVLSGEAIEAAEAGSARHPAARPLTILLVEPDAPVERRLLVALSGRGHRVVPVASAPEAADLTHRLRFDAVFCSIHPRGLNWIEFFEKIRYRIGAFVLLTEGFDTELANTLQESECHLLSKPLQETDLVRLMTLIEVKNGDP